MMGAYEHLTTLQVLRRVGSALHSLSLGRELTCRISRTHSDQCSLLIEDTKWPTSMPNKESPGSSEPSSGTSSTMEDISTHARAEIFIQTSPNSFGRHWVGQVPLSMTGRWPNDRTIDIILDDSCVKSLVTALTME